MGPKATERDFSREESSDVSAQQIAAILLAYLADNRCECINVRLPRGC